jgi:hypothetical protein
MVEETQAMAYLLLHSGVAELYSTNGLRWQHVCATARADHSVKGPNRIETV